MPAAHSDYSHHIQPGDAERIRAAVAGPTPDQAAVLAALCRAGEAVVFMIHQGDGPSYCVASEPTALAVAQDASTTPPDDGDTLLYVAVITRDGTLTPYPVTQEG